MTIERQTKELVDLVRLRYPNWEGFDHPDFVAEEVAYKRTLMQLAQEELSQNNLDHLIAESHFDEIIDRLDKLSHKNKMLWRAVPEAGDTAVLLHPNLHRPTFCTQLRNLLYADQPTSERLQHFSDYLTEQTLPNTWPFPTHWLFLCHPQEEIFVKPHAITWFLKFMGLNLTVKRPPIGEVYVTIRDLAHTLKNALTPYAVQDMLDVQSFIWVAYHEARQRIGRLNTRGQIALDVPQTDTAVAYDKPNAKESILKESSASTYQINPIYSFNQWATDTYHEIDTLATWVQAIERKGQAILYGPPGTGKTFMAEKMAQHLIGGGDGFVQLVQFHPAYAYEDFIQGIRPFSQPDGTLQYHLQAGRFLAFCEEAGQRNGRCLLIIDEINRANLATVFGELMYLLEYRHRQIPLAAGDTFHIPANVYLIGTMNTADRSIALVDHALRRRFAFIHLPFSENILRRYHTQTDLSIDTLITILKRINTQIDDPHYHVGHSFFMHPNLDQHLPFIWQMEIEPYLEEYFFDQPDRVDSFRWQAVHKQLTQR